MTTTTALSTDERLDRVTAALHEVNVTLERVRVSLTALARAGEDHEQRLRAIERWKHNLTPVIASATFVLGALFTEMLKRLI